MHDFLRQSIPEALAHTGKDSFDSHLQGVETILRLWNAKDEVCRAGLFHSIYGTEAFQGFKLALANRPRLRDLIGCKAERLAWIFCVVDRKTVDVTLYEPEYLQNQPHHGIQFYARPELGRFPIPLEDEEEWLDFLELSLADWLEQVEGAAQKENKLFGWKKGEAWSYRRRAFARMAEVLVERRGERLRAAKEMFEEVFAMEPAEAKGLHQEITPPMSDAAREARLALESINL